MTNGKHPVRTLSETAKHVKTIAKSPLRYQTMMNELFSYFDFSKLTNAVIPFAYDGTTWLAATQGNSSIRYGALNNSYAPWAMMLLCLRDEPSKIFDQVFDCSVSQNDYFTMRNRLNMFMGRVADARENGRRMFETDDILYCASVWYLLANAAEWSEGQKMNGHEFQNGFAGTARELIDVKRHERLLFDISQRLDGAYFHELDPAQQCWRMIKEDNKSYIQPDTVWIIAPSPDDMEDANGIIRQIDQIAHTGAKFIIVTDKANASVALEALKSDKDSGLGLFGSQTIMIEDTDLVCFTNVEMK